MNLSPRAQVYRTHRQTREPVTRGSSRVVNIFHDWGPNSYWTREEWVEGVGPLMSNPVVWRPEEFVNFDFVNQRVSVTPYPAPKEQ